ncbi:MAG TPA: hypothetical protein VKV22_05130 [Rhodanobacteraceae bacterium]|nr:hypothetical protein [Rhodanobacteraceae bacterium]
MTMIAPDRFIEHARRAYEWGRLEHAALQSSVALLLTAISVGVCRESAWSVAIGASLFVLATSLLWLGRTAARAARAGLRAGVLAFAIPIVVLHGYFGADCSIETVLIVNALTGLVVGVLLSVQAMRLGGRCYAYLFGAGTLVILSGTLGCLFFGPIGVTGMVVGYFVATAPVMVYRGATA